MTEPRKILRWLTIGSLLQSTLIFAIHFVLSEKISTARNSVMDPLYKSAVGKEHMDGVNHAFSSLSNDLFTIFLVGLFLTTFGYSLLRGIIKKNCASPH